MNPMTNETQYAPDLQESDRRANETREQDLRRGLIAGAFVGLMICGAPMLLAALYSFGLEAYGGGRGPLFLIPILLLISMAALFTAIHGNRVVSTFINVLHRKTGAQHGLVEFPR
jgi:hypothetical protein